MISMNTEATTIHAAELLLCGCRVDKISGAVFTACARHTCNVLARSIKLPPRLSLPSHPHGLKPLCPQCASYRISPDVDHVVCGDCGHIFQPSDIVGFALSVDSKPRPCHACNTIHYGVCLCNEGVGVSHVL